MGECKRTFKPRRDTGLCWTCYKSDWKGNEGGLKGERRKNENWKEMCLIFMFCCKDTLYCSLVLITEVVKKRKKPFSILIELCSLYFRGTGGESSVWEMNEIETRSGQMHNHNNQMLQGSRLFGEGLQHTSRKQTVLWHRRGDDVFPLSLRKVARKIIGRK